MRAVSVALVCLLAEDGNAARVSRAEKQDLLRADAAGQVAQRRDYHRVVCPVLAALHKAGDLVSDEDGNVELEQIKDALHVGLGIGLDLASFQAFGISAYDIDQKGVEESRNRCLPTSSLRCWSKRFIQGTIDNTTKRWFNMFTMNGKQVLEHGISTGVRGGDTNMPPDAIDCKGTYPCEGRFQQFFVENAEPDGRFYWKNLMRIVCLARQIGDRGGEMSYKEGSHELLGGWFSTPEAVPGREWQMKGAITATLAAFGQRDASGELFLSMSDMRAIMMESRYPDGWQRREHGCLIRGCDLSAVQRFRADVGECEVGERDRWWQSSSCNVFTGKTCGRSAGCEAGQTCVAGHCACGRGQNMRGMCFRNGECQEQPSDQYAYLGSPRRVYPADNPDAPGNPQ